MVKQQTDNDKKTGFAEMQRSNSLLPNLLETMVLILLLIYKFAEN